MSQSLEILRRRIEDKTANIGVIGLGYVGLPVACKFAEAGFSVVGVEIRPERVALINAGRSPIEGHEPGLADLLADVVESGRFRATTSPEHLRDVDVVLINVETPVDVDHKPRYDALRAALRELGTVLKAGGLVIIESTIAPGTIDRVVRPALEKAGRDVYLGHCPERVMPGKLLSNLVSMSRICGGSTPEVAATMQALYRHIVRADLDTADCVTAELVKTVENAYRDVNIAFANEVALICEAVGGDVWQVRDLVNKSPGRAMLLPGSGVGGHCIPKDPWLLAYGAGNDMDARLIRAAREVNDDMPLHIVRLTKNALRNRDLSLSRSRIAVLGYAYLEDSDDTRNSPSEVFVARLRESGAEVVIHDPWVAGYDGEILERVAGCHAVVLMVAHQIYRRIELAALKATLARPILIDARHVFDASLAWSVGLDYYGVGQPATLR